MNSPSLEGRTALVLGGSHGIGLGCARSLAQAGARVVITARRSEPLDAARAALLQHVPGARIETCVGDATVEDDAKAALQFAHDIAGRLDVTVAAVGGPAFAPLLMRDYDDVRREFDVNFMSAFLAVRHGAPLMNRDGSIICISTASVVQAYWGLSVYSAAKAAVERFVRASAFELGGAGIRVNAVRPGPTFAAEDIAAGGMAGVSEHSASETPLGRIGDPDDIGRVVRFLASDEARWVTGQNFSVDGGADQGKAFDLMDQIHGVERMARIRAGQAD